MSAVDLTYGGTCKMGGVRVGEEENPDLSLKRCYVWKLMCDKESGMHPRACQSKTYAQPWPMIEVCAILEV